MQLHYILGSVFLMAAMAVSFLLGSTWLDFSKIQVQGTPDWRIFWYVRFPRTMACLLTGSALSVAGALIQGVLNNRLASPSIIGVNAGAGLAITVLTAFGIYSGWPMTVGSFAGAFAAVLLISVGARKFGASRGTVILAGVALNSFFNAISQAIVTLSPETGVMSNDFKVGDFAAVTYTRLLPAAILIILVLIIVRTLAYDLEVLTLGEESAQGLGLDVKKKRSLFLVLAAVLSGSAVTMAGLVSFVGLLVPHAVRRLGITETRHLIPLCALYGGGFVTICDVAARTLFAPFEVPVGILLAFLGAPFFLYLLVKGKGGHGHA